MGLVGGGAWGVEKRIVVLDSNVWVKKAAVYTEFKKIKKKKKKI